MKQLILLSIFSITVVIVLIACDGGSNTNVSVNTNRMANTAGNALNTAVNTAGNAVNTVANAISNATTTKPADFMNEAAQGGATEVELGKLAVQKAKDPQVKKFGQMMIDDHTKAGADLKALAAKKNLTLPTGLGSHQSTVDRLKGLTGADFDKAYVDDMVDDHEDDVAAFQKEADNSSDPDVKAFAAKVLPVVKKHLDAIKAIKAKMK